MDYFSNMDYGLKQLLRKSHNTFRILLWTVGGLEVKKDLFMNLWISTQVYQRRDCVSAVFSFFLRWRTYICTLKCLACLTASSHRPWRASAWIYGDSSVSRSHRCTVNHPFRPHILMQSRTDSQHRIYQAIFSKTFELT